VIWGYIILGYLSLFALGLGDNSRGPLFPELLKNFSVTDAQGAWYYAVSSFLGFIGSYLVPHLLKKMNRIHVLQLSLILMVTGLVGMGFATGFAALLFWAGIFGFSLGVVGVIQNVLVTVGSTPRRRQRMLSGLHAVYGMSSLLAPLIVAGVMSLTESWRTVFWTVAVVPALLLFASFVQKEPKISADEKHEKSVNHTKITRKENFAQIYLGMGLGLYVMAEIMVSSRLALYVRREFSLSLPQSSYYVTGFFVCLLAGRLLFALVHFKWSLRLMLSLSLLLSFMAIVCGLKFHPLFFALSGFTMGPFYPLAVAYIYQHFKMRIDAAIAACMAIQSFLTVLMHTSVGYLTDLYGIDKALWLGPIVLVLALLILNSFESLFRKNL